MTNNFTIYNASAGSGKTFTLVKEYLLLLFKSKKPDAYKNILAITFTNKAVDEMKSRIISSLRDFTGAETSSINNPLFKIIAEEIGLSEAELKTRAAKILKSIIHNYAAFEVSTIDGFTHRVLRTFAKDLGLPVNFEIALNTRQILMEAVDRLISKAGTDKELTKVLISFAISKTDDDKSWDIAKDLFEISELLIGENHQEALKKLKGKTPEDFQSFKARITSEIKKTEAIIAETSTEFFDLVESNNIEEKDFSGGYVYKHFVKLRDQKSIDGFEKSWMLKLESAPLYAKSNKNQAVKDALDSIQSLIVSLFEISKRAYLNLDFLEAIRKNLTQLSLLNAINQEVELIKKERNLILISEFNPKISAQVKDQPAPFIYERLGERYQNYFIDEFQDTSQMQWENLIPLIDNKLSSENIQDPASAMLVGDAKQSIYRWRGGKAEQFIDLCLDTNPFSIEKYVENLPDNYRSGSQIVNFNNSLFNYASGTLQHPAYSNLFQESSQNPKKGDFGYVNIDFIEAENAAEEHEIYPEKILEIIQNLEQKKFKKGDICILTRKKKEGITIASYLSENNIPVVSSETLLVANSSEVNFIAHLLEFSLSPKDNTLKLELFDFLADFLEIENRYPIISANLPKDGKSFFNWLKDYNIDFDLDEIRHLSVYEAAEYIIRSFSLVETSNAYVQFFLDFIFESTQKATAGIADFIDLWKQEIESLSIVVPKAEDAVQIMTIHKSKGLEFPVVIYPYANSDSKSTRMDSLWLPMEPPLDEIPMNYLSASDKMLNWGPKASDIYTELIHQKELDTLNVLYVACTRASQQLYLLSKKEIDAKGNEKAYKTSGLLIGYLKEIGRWDANINTYEFGEIGIPKASAETHSENIISEKFYSSATQNKAVNIVTKSGMLWDSKQEEAIEKGEILHELLAQIDFKEQVKPVVTQAVNNGIITKDSAEKIEKLLLEITNHPQLSEYYAKSATSFNERDILTPEGKRLRPDRINFSGKTVNIIDYKTGKFDISHEAQINSYAGILEDMGYKIGSKNLVYTNKALKVRLV
ncbi:UvrD-helicase domain-containing protein [Salegentibacter salegens]|uniref:DNA 3'-5' helicase n=1 Tax=Salegentibacter salegens TaxID=143223 RepID=A0A1M7M7K5_9FLAO|nr:UvrD-helicase domain-containing protein [Salegentibacter salegens]PRX51533.1 ATP-dependent exoDNAse (exonuclease V) beta subunit [Salegentibacter salegens]SHM86643.1 ATP-dependent exoDNAse (exonuclease V) beta subunit (contains helicase and exonuclease domains) [Salegentibacter salegens]